MKEYILALDQGTTSSRAVLFNRRGNLVGLAQNEFAQHYPQPGWVEHDPMDILRSQFHAVTQVLQENGISPSQVAAIGITNQRETAVVWDRNTGEPVCNAIVWQCRRTAPLCDRLIAQGKGELITEKTGLLIDAYFSGSKIRWILDQVPGARDRAKRGELLFGTVDSWLIWNLTGGHVHATDYTNASRTMLFDIDKLCWDEELLSLLEIPSSMLPQVLPSSHVYGHVSRNAPFGMDRLAGIPIAGAAGDQHAALFGQACFSPGQAKNTYGTGCFLLMNTGKKRIRSKHGLISTIAWGTEEGVEYALEGSVFNAGSVIKWLRDDLRLIATSRECDVLAETVPDTNGVYFVPAFTGLGAPYWDMYARGTILGLTRGAGRAHLARAVLESIAYQVADVLAAMTEDAEMELKELRVDGGASVSDIMMQFQSDLLQIPVNRPKNVETTSLGAAFLAGLAVGFWQSREDLQNSWESERIFTPVTDERRMQALYTNWRRAVERAKGWEEGK